MDKINNKLSDYYHSLNREYSNEFAQYCEDQGIDDDMILDDLQSGSHVESMLTDFDAAFPFNSQCAALSSPKQKEYIYKILYQIISDEKTINFVDGTIVNSSKQQYSPDKDTIMINYQRTSLTSNCIELKLNPKYTASQLNPNLPEIAKIYDIEKIYDTQSKQIVNLSATEISRLLFSISIIYLICTFFVALYIIIYIFN